MTGLLTVAREQLADGDAHACRRACWLARSAVEDRVEELLAAASITVDGSEGSASMRAKLSCLEVAYAGTPAVAATAQYVWSRLSQACHQHAYELSPTYAEAAHLLDLIESLS